jgi:hypothetical protein
MEHKRLPLNSDTSDGLLRRRLSGDQNEFRLDYRAGLSFLRDYLEIKEAGRPLTLRRDGSQIFTAVMLKHTEPMMDYCEFFATEEEAIAACREVNRGLNSKDPACCVVVDGPENNYAVVDLETAKDLLDFGEESQLPCLIVTD